MNVSIFQSAKVTKPLRNLSVDAFFDCIKTGEWQDEVLQYRTGKLEKVLLKSVTPSGTFRERNKQGIIEHSNLICIDVDEKDQICQINIEHIKSDPYTFAMHRSVSGKNNSYAVYIKIDGNRHADAFLGLEKYFFSNFGVVVDKACKDVSRLRFVSYDPECYVYKQSKIFKKYLTKEHKKILNYNFPTVIKTDFDELVSKAKHLNLFDDYEDYINLAFGLASEFGESGRDYFYSLCSSSSKYEQKQAEKDYTTACNRKNSGITIKTVYWKFKQAGLELISQKTKEVISIKKLSQNPEKELEKRGLADIPELQIDTNIPQEIQELIELIRLNKTKFNEVTRQFEMNGEVLDDRSLSNFYCEVWEKIDAKMSKDKIFTYIQNKNHSESYNPIHDFFERNKNIVTNNEFKKLVNCFNIDAKIAINGDFFNVDDYLQVFLKKWLLGIIGSAYGTYSLMILVLVGKQGTRKTEFFRNLLPEDLQSFYSESNLDEAKDSEILMTKKLLIIDDEFGGKSKRDATKLKRLSSQQTFSIRMPYGRLSEDLNRLAVLGGTSNEEEVINDPTGNRRIIPVNVVGFDFETYKKIDKTKLFIELYKEWEKDKQGWFLTTKEIEALNLSTEKNTEIMQEEEIILQNFVAKNDNEMTNSDIKNQIEREFLSIKTSTKRIGQALKKCGYNKKAVFRNGKTLQIYNIIHKNQNDL